MLLIFVVVFYIALLSLNFYRFYLKHPEIKYENEGKTFYYSIHNFSTGWSKFFNFFIFGKTPLFYNIRRGNSYFYTALQTTFFISLIVLALHYGVLESYYLDSLSFKYSIDMEMSPFNFVTSFFILFATIFWYERNEYYNKWKYLASSYKDFAFCDNSIQTKRRFIDFLHDLHKMNMMGHETFENIFGQFLYELGKINTLETPKYIDYYKIPDFISEYEREFLLEDEKRYDLYPRSVEKSFDWF